MYISFIYIWSRFGRAPPRPPVPMVATPSPAQPVVWCDSGFGSALSPPWYPPPSTPIDPVTVDTFHPGLCHEGIENATVTRIAFLSGPLPVAVDPRKEHDDDDDDDDDADDDVDDDDDGDDVTMRLTMMTTMMIIMMLTISKHPGRPKPRTTSRHRGAEGGRRTKNLQSIHICMYIYIYMVTPPPPQIYTRLFRMTAQVASLHWYMT